MWVVYINVNAVQVEADKKVLASQEIPDEYLAPVKNEINTDDIKYENGVSESVDVTATSTVRHL